MSMLRRAPGLPMMLLTTLGGLQVAVASDAAPVAAARGLNKTLAPTALYGGDSGCDTCCTTGSCYGAFRNSPGLCCSTSDIACCPNQYFGKSYSCLQGYDGWKCVPGSAPSAPYSMPEPAPAPAPAPTSDEICNRDTGGTCRLFPCAESRGHADCIGGQCLCRPGYCSFGGRCMRTASCFKETPGTCHVLSCKESRGATECVGGHCNCKEDACMNDGVCYPRCEKDTGGTCSFFGCGGWRNAQCVSGKCLCESDSCAVDGRCASGESHEELALAAGNMTAALLGPKAGPWGFGTAVFAALSSPTPSGTGRVMLALHSVIVVSVVLLLALIRVHVRGGGASLREPLLVEGGATAAGA